MGNCCPIQPHTDVSYSSDEPDPDPQIDSIKLLLLGAGESGKSTLFKQMMINYDQSYSPDVLFEEKPRIIRSIYVSFRNYIAAVRKIDPTLGGNPDLVTLADEIFPDQQDLPVTIPDRVKKFMLTIWTSQSGKEIWENHEKYPIIDSLSYFMNDLERVSDKGYSPTESDMLNARIRTAGILEQTFVYRGVTTHVVDVGGQRSERPKWFKCLDNVTSVLFVASLSEFDQTLYEDSTVMRLPEALELFKKAFNFLIFRKSNTPFVLFLNKEDLLKEKLLKMEEEGKDLDEYFPDLGLGTNYDNVVEKVKEHIKNLFLSQCNEQDLSRVIPHYITATDKNIFLRVFQAAAQVVIRRALEDHFRQHQQED